MRTSVAKSIDPGLPTARRRAGRFVPARAPVDPAALLIVALLALLFAAAIVCALHPAPPVDLGQASLQGGL